MVLYREAAAGVPEVAQARVSTWRQRLWKVGAWVQRRAGRLCFHVSASWPGQALWRRVQEAVTGFAQALGCGVAAPPAAAGVVM